MFYMENILFGIKSIEGEVTKSNRNKTHFKIATILKAMETDPIV